MQFAIHEMHLPERGFGISGLQIGNLNRHLAVSIGGIFEITTKVGMVAIEDIHAAEHHLEPDPGAVGIECGILHHLGKGFTGGENTVCFILVVPIAD